MQILLLLLNAATAHAQFIPASVMALAGEGTSTAAGIAPWIAPAAGLIGGVAGGLIGLIGGNNQNSANEAEQQQAEAYNTQMADTVYQRTTADMKAAGINPMFLAMGAGTNPAPTAPMYTNTNTLTQFASNASDIDSIVKKYLDARGEDSQNQITAANASTAQGIADATLDTTQTGAQNAQALLQKNMAAAHVATATQQNDIDQSGAETSKSMSEAKSAATDADWASADHWNKFIGGAANSAEKVMEGFGIGKFLRNMNGTSRYNPNTTGTFDKRTGEIHE